MIFTMLLMTIWKCVQRKQKKPEIAYKGSFNIRISPELHRRLAIYATAHNISLNRYIEDTLEKSPAAQTP